MSGKILLPVMSTLILAFCALPRAANAQTLVPAPTDPLPPATEPPPTQPVPTVDQPDPTATTVPPPLEPTPFESGGSRREVPQPPPPTEGPPPVGGPTVAFRTPRPTRTPRAVTPTATPLSAAAFRLTVSADPPAVRRGDTLMARIVLMNQSPFTVSRLLLEIVLPPGFQLEGASPLTGTTERAGAVLSWTIPDLDAGMETRLTVRGQVQSVEQGMALCATLLSSGSPVESCIALAPSTGADDDGSASQAALSSPVFATGSGGATPLQWILLLLGLLLLGLWGGTALRARRASRHIPAGPGSE